MTGTADRKEAPAAAAPVAPEARLKQLLLAPELALIRRLEAGMARLDARVGDDAALTRSVAGVVVGVLRDAGIRDHERLADALAPLIVASLREEIRNSRDMMVDALYPLTGRLVAAAVSNAFRELLETLDERLDQSLSFERWKIRLQAWTTGASEAELLLLAHPPFRVDELLLIHRPTGLLMARAHSDKAEGPDADVVGAMLTAIMAFTRDAFGAAGSGELRSLMFGDSELFLRTSPAVILAVKARGTPPAGFDRAFEALFLAFLERWGEVLRDFTGAADAAAGSGLADDLAARFRRLAEAPATAPRKSKAKALALVGMLAAAAIAWGAWSVVDARRIAAIEDTARGVIAADERLAGYPLTVRFEDEAGTLRVGGLVPDAAARDDLARRLAAALPSVALALRVNMPPDPGAALAARLDPRLDAVADDLAALGRDVRTLDAALAELRRTAAPVDAALAAIGGRLDRIEARLADPVDRLHAWTRHYAIFFAAEAEFRDPAGAGRKLDDLADLLGAAPAGVRLRIVGYADELGGAAGTVGVSEARARAVADALIARGVPADRLIAVGRADERPLHAAAGRNSPNRRVEFELAYEAE